MNAISTTCNHLARQDARGHQAECGQPAHWERQGTLVFLCDEHARDISRQFNLRQIDGSDILGPKPQRKIRRYVYPRPAEYPHRD